MMTKRALFSVDNLCAIEGFAAALGEMGWHIIATKESVVKLKQHSLDVEDVADFVKIKEPYGFPPTLHPKIETALTTDAPYRIDLVYDIPYTLEKGNDVGGRTLLALAAKGNRIVAFTPDDMQKIIDELRQDPKHTSITPVLRSGLVDKVNAHIAQHFLTLAQREGKSKFDGLCGVLASPLLNGENPYQVPADLFCSNSGDKLSLSQFQALNDTAPCFTNAADSDCIMHTLCLAASAFSKRYGKIPFIAVAAKHGNPCGMAIDWDSSEQETKQALFGNPLAIWGGEFICNFEISVDCAQLLYASEERKAHYGNSHWMLDVVIAPDYKKEAKDILSKKSSRKVYKNPALSQPKLSDAKWHYRQVRGGFLRQPLPQYILDFTSAEKVFLELSDEIVDDGIIAWSAAFSSFHGGNEVALAKGRQLIGIAGGPSTFEAAKSVVARIKACRHTTQNAMFAADAFFPFVDAPRVLSNAGCRYGIVPTGGKQESAVKDFFQENKIGMIYIPSQFRGFYRH